MKIAFFDAKQYDKIWFDKLNSGKYEIKYIETNLCEDSAILARDCDVVVAFVNDILNKETIDILCELNIKLIAMRCAGYNNVNLKNAYKKINIVRVPAYSPYAVAEHAFGLILALNRKSHKAYNRTRDFNFSLNGLLGFDLYGKTIGVIGTGKIGQVLIKIAKGFGMNILAYNPISNNDLDVNFVPLDELFKQSDIISLHCPLTKETKHIINKNSIEKMKKGVFIINTSRGALINSEDLLEALQIGKVGAAGLDVYEEESEWFFEDCSDTTLQDKILSLLISQPNVLVTSHQAFFTNEALKNIAEVTYKNIEDFFAGKPLINEICYRCVDTFKTNCPKINGRCF